MEPAEREDMLKRLSNERGLGEKKAAALFGLIKLNANCVPRHYYATLFHSLLIGFFVNGVELLQQSLLINKDYYGFGTSEALQYNSFITLEDLIVKLLVTPIYGVYVDRFGRQKMILFGYALIILSFVLFPIHYYSSFFSSLGWYFGIRFIYSNGSAVIPIVPLLADYVDNASKGKAIGISCLLVTVGTSLSTLLISIMAEKNPFITYMIFTGTVGIIGIAYTFLLKSGNKYYITPRTSCQVETSGHLMSRFSTVPIRNKRMEMVKKDCKEKPWIVASYIFALLNGVLAAISTQILNLYVQSFINISNAAKLGPSIVLKANIASTIVSIVLGPTLDIVRPIYIGVLAFATAVGAFCSIGAIDDPNSIGLTLIAVGVGIAYSCTLMLTKYLGFKNYRTSIRGILFSIANIMIMIGVTIVAVIGGNLFKYLGRDSPFYIAAIFAVICSMLFTYLYIKHIRPKEKRKSVKAKVGEEARPSKGPFEMLIEEQENLDSDEEEEKDNTDQEQNFLQDGWDKSSGKPKQRGPSSEPSQDIGGLMTSKRSSE